MLLPLPRPSGSIPGVRSSPKLLSALKLAGFVNATVLSAQEVDRGGDEAPAWDVTDSTVRLSPEDLKNVVITEVRAQM